MGIPVFDVSTMIFLLQFSSVLVQMMCDINFWHTWSPVNWSTFWKFYFSKTAIFVVSIFGHKVAKIVINGKSFFCVRLEFES